MINQKTQGVGGNGMGWRGTVRSFSAAVRAAERDAQRRHKVTLKEQVAADSAAAVTDWETYVDELISVHTDVADAIDWRAMAARPQPEEPRLATTHQHSAKAALAAFKPSLFDAFRGGTAKRRARLEADLADAARP